MTIPEKYRPAYKIEIKSSKGNVYEFNTKEQVANGKPVPNVNKLTVYIDRDLNLPLDVFRIRIAQKSGKMRAAGGAIGITGTQIETGSIITIYLGYMNARGTPVLRQVFKGVVDEIYQDMKNVVITGYSMAYLLINSYLPTQELTGDNRRKLPYFYPETKKDDKPGQSIPKVTSSKIIKKLVEPVGKDCTTGTIDDGLSLTDWEADMTQSIYRNIEELVRYSGNYLYWSRLGSLTICQAKGNSTKTREYKYGVDIIDQSVTLTAPQYDNIEIVGEGASKDGVSQYQITAQPVVGKKATTGPDAKKNKTIKLAVSMLRDPDTSNKVAENLLKLLRVSEVGSITVLGDPEVELADKIKITVDSSMPGGRSYVTFARPAGKCIVTRISHKYNMHTGFTTTIGWIGSEGSKGGTSGPGSWSLPVSAGSLSSAATGGLTAMARPKVPPRPPRPSTTSTPKPKPTPTPTSTPKPPRPPRPPRTPTTPPPTGPQGGALYQQTRNGFRSVKKPKDWGP